VKNWRFAFSRRYFGYLAMAIVFALACVALSNWQFARKAETKAANDLINTNYARTPVAIDDILPKLDSWKASIAWTPVTVSGTYDVADQLLVRNRTYNGNPGFEVLTPLKLANGTTFIVDRGWVSIGDKTDYPDSVPTPPSGNVTVVARVQQTEAALPGRNAPKGQVPEIDLGVIAKTLGTPTYTGAYGLMASESPSARGGDPVAAIKPQLDEGLHLSYALQWIFFALFGFFGLGYALRQEFRARNVDDPDEMVRAERRERKAAARPLTDAEIEDAQIDAMQR
jgi:cytochrome oxidase assembly protein ShyY1